ncbi:MAG: ATP synthase F0 subunit B [Syntrophorhabdales bacterium]|jgi:F-type H+-transporting ATPase subunit b
MGLGRDLPVWLHLLLQFVNFAILVGVLVYFLRKPLKGFLKNRQYAVKEKIEQAERAIREAEELKKAYQERLSRIEGEIDAFRASVLGEVEKEKKRILDGAHALAGRIGEQARLAYEQEMKEATARIRTEIAERTTREADRKVREMFKEEDHDRMVEEFIQKVRSVN